MRAQTPIPGGGILVFGVVASLVAFAVLTAIVSLSPCQRGGDDPELSTFGPLRRELEPIHAANTVPWDDVQLSLSAATWEPALNPTDVMPVSGHIASVSGPRRTRGLFGWLKRRRRLRDTEDPVPRPPAPRDITRNRGVRMNIRF